MFAGLFVLGAVGDAAAQVDNAFLMAAEDKHVRAVMKMTPADLTIRWQDFPPLKSEGSTFFF
jgi:hypothetical protein